MNKDLNYIAALEKAISEKYGETAIINPKSLWNEEKEKNYLEQTKEKLKVECKNDSHQHNIDLDGFLIPKKLINSAQKRKCEYCDTYSFNREDDVYFSKYETCRKCYVNYIEDREERWKQGWRPKKME
jgi:hypothetical protein